MVDIGAHKGFFTVFAAKAAKRVISFEPAPVNNRFLRKNVELNGLNNVTVRDEAVADIPGDRSFLISGRTAARNTFFRSSLSGPGGKMLTVRCTTLADVIRDYELDRIDLLKVDCEGGEYDALLRSDPSALGKVNAIALEIHEGQGIPGTKAKLVAHLEAIGFRGSMHDERVMDGVNLTMAFFERPQS